MAISYEILGLVSNFATAIHEGHSGDAIEAAQDALTEAIEKLESRPTWPAPDAPVDGGCYPLSLRDQVEALEGFVHGYLSRIDDTTSSGAVAADQLHECWIDVRKALLDYRQADADLGRQVRGLEKFLDEVGGPAVSLTVHKDANGKKHWDIETYTMPSEVRPTPEEAIAQAEVEKEALKKK